MIGVETDRRVRRRGANLPVSIRRAKKTSRPLGGDMGRQLHWHNPLTGHRATAAQAGLPTTSHTKSPDSGRHHSTLRQTGGNCNAVAADRVAVAWRT
ncbi:hypothetical protein TcasGA2_TC004739 [Tribolium castaneum]|uniref:Uncharacterized protein n=1 Tax=Tribolium castaneum TaxID=7070 RepID=D6W7A4_TRICA|nr:hypothetical protein TcasGA2_TC004739 [Tribolium castaneum]